MTILKIGHISEAAARRAKVAEFRHPWDRKIVYVQLLELWSMVKFHAQIWQFLKSTHISETVSRIAKIRSISPPPLPGGGGGKFDLFSRYGKRVARIGLVFKITIVWHET